MRHRRHQHRRILHCSAYSAVELRILELLHKHGDVDAHFLVAHTWVSSEPRKRPTAALAPILSRLDCCTLIARGTSMVPTWHLTANGARVVATINPEDNARSEESPVAVCLP